MDAPVSILKEYLHHVYDAFTEAERQKINEAIAILSSYPRWQPLIEAAGKVDKDAALKFLERVNEDEEMVDSNGLCVYPLMQIRSLLDALPEEE